MKSHPFAPLSAVLAGLLISCGPATPAQAPDAPKEADSAAASTSATPASSATDAPKASAPEDSPSASLARDLLKSGGRRIAWSSTKKRFIVPVDARTEGGGRGLDLRFYDDEGNQRDIQRICQPGECEDRLDEIIKETLPKLASRIESEGYESVSSIGWPSGRAELDVGTLNGTLHQDRGRLSLTRDKKPAVTLRAVGGRAPKVEPSALYPVVAAKLLGVMAGEFFVFKLP